ncbi:MAG TPA: lytic transglycosylase domain-containing protein [Myxococcaceae bacterium]|nr:lytic transglycosylase domain-containing protein [Myxococcaceae bacterium]
MALSIGVVSNAGADAGEQPTRAIEQREPREVERLQDLLAKREAELAAMRDRLRVLEDEERWYAEADVLGIGEVLRRSALTERAQRRVAIAIVREAEANGLDPLLVVAVIRAESSFNVYAVSGVGALGLMQMMPTTGSFLATRRGTTLRHRQTLFDAELNIELGTAYLASLLREFGTVEAALLAYNGGPAYARRVLRNSEARKRLAAGYPRDVIDGWRRLRLRHDEVQARRSLPAADRTLAAERTMPSAQ